jgi:hypothetical protein
MKYFTKKALLWFNKQPDGKAPVKSKPIIKPFRTYSQTIESLPTYALRRRLAKLQASASVYKEGTMPDEVKQEFLSRVNPIIQELRARGESV